MSTAPTRRPLEQDLLELEGELVADLRQRLEEMRRAVGLALDVVDDLAERVHAAGEQGERVAQSLAALVDEQPAA